MSGLQRFRKKPVVIEAMQFTGLDSYLAIFDWMKASGSTVADEVRYETPLMLIPTLEGLMAASPGDWVIKGVQGEFYPCKPDVFEATYEPADVVARDETTELKAGFDKMVYRLDAALQEANRLRAAVREWAKAADDYALARIAWEGYGTDVTAASVKAARDNLHRAEQALRGLVGGEGEPE